MNFYWLQAEADVPNKKTKTKKELLVSVRTKPGGANAKVTWVFTNGLAEHQVPSVDIPSTVLASGPTLKAVYKLGFPLVFDYWEIEAEIKFPLTETAWEYRAKYGFSVTVAGTKILMDFEATLGDPGPYLVIDRNGDPPDDSPCYDPDRRHRLNASISAECSGTPVHP
jgi:hypothetical protein